MKIFSLIPTLFLSLILTSCDSPDGDFKNEKVVIIKKIQDRSDKDKEQARYRIRFGDDTRRGFDDLVLVLPENFGEVGDIIQTTNKVLYASPEIERIK